MAKIALRIVDMHQAYEQGKKPNLRVNVESSESTVNEAYLDDVSGMVTLKGTGYPDVIVPASNIKWMEVLAKKPKPKPKPKPYIDPGANPIPNPDPTPQENLAKIVSTGNKAGKIPDVTDAPLP